MNKVKKDLFIIIFLFLMINVLFMFMCYMIVGAEEISNDSSINQNDIWNTWNADFDFGSLFENDVENNFGSDFENALDTNKPEIYVEGLCDKEIYKDSVNIFLKATDDTNGLNIRYKCVLMLEDGTKRQVEDVTEHIDGTSFEKSISYVEEGVYDITFYAYDDAGNGSEIRSYSVGLDTVAPDINFDGFDTTKPYKDKVELNICVKDLFYEGLKVDVSIYKVSKDSMIEIPSGEYSVKAVSNKNIYSFESDGTFIVHVKAYDKSMHESNKEIAFTIDKTPPLISIDLDGKEYEGEEFISDKPKINVSIGEKNYNGGTLSISLIKKILSNSKDNKESAIYENIPINDNVLTGENTIIPIELRGEGNYDLTITATDAMDNTSSEHINFTVDSKAPTIGFLSEYNEKYLKSFTLPNDLSGYISDVTGVHYKAFLNSKETGSGEIKKDGKYILQVVAWDDAGNSNEEMIAFIVDNTKPQVIINGLNDNGNMNKDKPITLSLKDSNDYFTNIYVNGEKLKLSGDKRTAELIPTEYGSYRIYVSAVDPAGNVTTETINTNCEAILAAPTSFDAEPIEVKTLVRNSSKANSIMRNPVFLWVLCGVISALAIIFVVIAVALEFNNRY